MERAVGVRSATSSAELRRQYAKLCDVRDFEEALRERIRDIVPGRDSISEVHRKHWEFAQLTFFLEDVGLGEETQILSVGAGHEEVLFWLTNRAGRVVATDIYGEGAFIGNEAEATMLTDPDAFAPYPYRRDRLEVHKMDARQLEFPDASFDAVFTLSSIEHFGSSTDVALAAKEIGRVLRPGGHAFVVTECFLSPRLIDSRLFQTAVRGLSLGRLAPKASPRRRAIDVFTYKEIEHAIIEPSGLQLMQPIDRTVSEETLANVIPLRGGRVDTLPGREFPHITLRAEEAFGPLVLRSGIWTSVALPLAKPAA